MDFGKRLDFLKYRIREKEFLNGKGLGNEVPFWIFDYPPEKEILMRDTVRRLIASCTKESISVKEIDLYDLCLSILFQKVPEGKINKLEANKGSKLLYSKLKLILRPEVVRNEVQKQLDSNKFKLILITGIGKVWPLQRSHTILNNLQTVVHHKTLIMFYPGKYSGNDLSLFGKLEKANYYRAFQLIPNLQDGDAQCTIRA